MWTLIVTLCKCRDTIIEKVGNWVSPGYANDDNNYFWELPLG